MYDDLAEALEEFIDSRIQYLLDRNGLDKILTQVQAQLRDYEKTKAELRVVKEDAISQVELESYLDELLSKSWLGQGIAVDAIVKAVIRTIKEKLNEGKFDY